MFQRESQNNILYIIIAKVCFDKKKIRSHYYQIIEKFIILKQFLLGKIKKKQNIQNNQASGTRDKKPISKLKKS
jgi:hypothetical protein